MIVDTLETIRKMINYPKIVLVPGHSPENPGAVGNKQKENSLAINLCELIMLEMKENSDIPINYEVIHGKTAGEYLKNSVDYVKKIHKVDKNIIAIAIHFDATASKEAKGGHIICYPDSKVGKELANCIQKRLVKIFPGRAKQVDERKLYWTSKAPCPAILMEICFITNKNDVDIFLSKKEIVAREIVDGIEEYVQGIDKEV